MQIDNHQWTVQFVGPPLAMRGLHLLPALNRLFEDLEAAAGRGSDMSTFNAGLRYLLLEAHDQYRQASTPETGGEVHPAVAKPC